MDVHILTYTTINIRTIYRQPGRFTLLNSQKAEAIKSVEFLGES